MCSAAHGIGVRPLRRRCLRVAAHRRRRPLRTGGGTGRGQWRAGAVVQGGVSRDRDATGRPRNVRPRDPLGRPLPRIATGGPPVDEPALPPSDALAHAQELLDAGEAFAAHETLEAVWKATTGAERALWRGLAQLCVGLTHAQRGNLAGATGPPDRAAGQPGEAAAAPRGAAPPWGASAPAALAAWARRASGSPADARPPRLVTDVAR